MRKDIGLYIFLTFAIIALYLTTKTYNYFSLDKSLSACIYAQMKKNNDLKLVDAEKFCENNIKKKKN